MSTAAYNGIFLAPESIVVFPGFNASALNASVDATRADETLNGSARVALPGPDVRHE
ncbi:MAG: hypothetical protein K0R53_1125 [Burkholderiales bacterium]|jgi:hypothetical protein|nr:hypothetical protein [Burkholderiales bacterium]